MSDLRLDGDRDLALNGAGDDVLTIDGADLVAQDVAEALATPLGSLPWDPDAGSDLHQWLLLETVEAAAIIAELERVATADPRVDAATVTARQLPDGTFRLGFRTLDGVEISLPYEVPG